MKIKDIVWRNGRRDFKAVFECEGCGNKVTEWGYDDANFHDNVIPKLVCEKCGKTGAECGANYRPLATKFPEGYQV